MPEKRCKYVNSDKFVVDKRCIIRIQNQDELCCARALVTAKARLDKHEKWDTIRQGRPIQATLAADLHRDAGVPLGICGIPEIKQFQEYLIDYQINVVSKEYFGAIIYSGPEADKKLYIYSHDDHYDVITSMPAFLTKSYYCTQCQMGYDHKEKHKCNNTCLACRKIHEEHDDAWIPCNICNRYFKGEDCFSLHQRTTKNGNSTCNTFYRCTDCGHTINNKRKTKQHVCGEILCKLCEGHFPPGHKCYMLQEESDAVPTSIEEELIQEYEHIKTYIFFDFECTQDDILQCDEGYISDSSGKCVNCEKANCGAFEHRPNLCVVHKVCTRCMDTIITPTSECERCGNNEMVFRGPNTVNQFCVWLFSEINYNATVMCHNFQGYDSYPILQYLYKKWYTTISSAKRG